MLERNAGENCAMHRASVGLGGTGLIFSVVEAVATAATIPYAIFVAVGGCIACIVSIILSARQIPNFC